MADFDEDTDVVPSTMRGVATATEVAIGARVGRYIVLSELARGGMGRVLVAYDPELDRRVALKLIQYHAPNAGEAQEMRLFREAQALARVSHPNVVAVYDVGLHEGHVFLAMEMVTGIDLNAWLEQPRSVAAIIAVFCDAARGLAAVHRAGLVHRDFKPSNVLLGDDGRVRVLDFGLARASGTEEVRLRPSSLSTEMSSLLTPITVQGELSGTLSYLAPELLAGKTSTPAVDQFAFGISLYEALFRARPFQASQLGGYADAVRRGLPPWPAKKAPPAYLRCLARCLAFLPEDRFPSMDAVVEQLAADPYRARKRTAALAGLVALLLVGVSSLVWKEHQRRAECLAQVNALDEDFSDARRAALGAHFDRLAGEQGRAIYMLVDQQLENELKRWKALTATTCEALTTQDPVEPKTRLRRGCLERKAEAVRELLLLLEAADAAIVDRVPDFARQLVHADCSSDRALLWKSADLVPEALQTNARALRRDLIRAHAFVQMGRHDRAEQLAEQVIFRARSLGLRGFEAEALYEFASARANDDPEEGVRKLSEALVLAQSEGIDDVSIAIAERLVVVQVVELGKLADAEWVYRWAQAIAARMGNDDAVEFALNKVAAPLLKRAKDKAPLVSEARRQLELAARLWPDDWSLRVALQQELSLALWIDAQLERSNTLDVETLRLAERHGLATTLVKRRAFADIATGAHAIGDSEGALGYAEQVVAIVRAELESDAVEEAGALMELAEVLIERDPRRALEVLEESRKLLEQSKLMTDKAQLHGLRARALLELGRIKEALAACEAARAYVAALLNPQDGFVRANNMCLAEAHRRLGQDDLAWKHLRLAKSVPPSHTPRARVELLLLEAELVKRRDREDALRLISAARDELRAFPKMERLRQRVEAFLRVW